DPEAGWLAFCAVSQRNVDRERHAVLRGRTPEGNRADALHSADHEFRREFRIASDLASDPSACSRPTSPQGLVARRPARTADRFGAWCDPRAYRSLQNRGLAKIGLLRLWRALAAHCGYRRSSACRNRHLRFACGLHAALYPAATWLRSRQ